MHGDGADSPAASGGAPAGTADPGPADQQRLESYPLAESPEQRRQGRHLPWGEPSSSGQLQQPPEEGARAAAAEGTVEPDLARAPASSGLPGAAHGAGSDMRWRAGPVHGLGFAGGFEGATPLLRVLGAEWHSRVEQDWYAPTVAVDLFTFIYVALFYQVRLG